MLPEDMYVMDSKGKIISEPTPKPKPHKRPKCTDCCSLFFKVTFYFVAFIILHGENCQNAPLERFPGIWVAKRRSSDPQPWNRILFSDNARSWSHRVQGSYFSPSQPHSQTVLELPLTPTSPIQITHMEMIKGIAGHGYFDKLVVPIIENTAHEYELTDTLEKAVILTPLNPILAYFVYPFFCN